MTTNATFLTAIAPHFAWAHIAKKKKKEKITLIKIDFTFIHLIEETQVEIYMPCTYVNALQ